MGGWGGGGVGEGLKALLQPTNFKPLTLSTFFSLNHFVYLSSQVERGVKGVCINNEHLYNLLWVFATDKHKLNMGQTC